LILENFKANFEFRLIEFSALLKTGFTQAMIKLFAQPINNIYIRIKANSMHSPNASKQASNENAARINYETARGIYLTSIGLDEVTQNLLQARTFVNLSIQYKSNKENEKLLNDINQELKRLGYTL